MEFDRAKFKALVHCVCAKSSDPTKLGATKLNKICWLTDFVSYYRTGFPLSGAVYIKRQFGPVPRAIQSTIEDLERERAIAVSEKLFFGKPQRQFHLLREPNQSVFTSEQLALIGEVTSFVCEEHTAASISALSHDHVWKAASDGEEIPYYTIFANPVPVSPLVREWALQEIETIGS